MFIECSVTLICEKRDKMNLLEFVVIMHILKVGARI